MATEHIDVRKIAKLSRIDLTDSEVAQYQEQLESIIGHIDQLKEVDVSEIKLEEGRFGPLRKDIARPGLGAEGLLQNAPDQAQGQVRVPKVVDPS